MLVFFFFTIFIILTTATTSLLRSTNHETGCISAPTTRSELSRCAGSTVGDLEEYVLATTKYISYESLKKNSVPCSQKGASYYNCKPGA
ncbi:hypothetical protein MKX03_018434 [Papaver bracteatum]|nr:hypothetical protein MKX03_018434 [Papaver bracteatum]